MHHHRLHISDHTKFVFSCLIPFMWKEIVKVSALCSFFLAE